MQNISCAALIKKTLLSLIITLIVYAIFFEWIDLPFMLACNQIFANTTVWYIASIIALSLKANYWLFVGIIALLIGAMHLIRKKPKASTDTLILFGLSLVIAFVIGGAIKVILARYRPEMLFNNNLYGFHFFSTVDAENSTPSGHVLMAFAGLFALSRHFNRRNITLILMLIACLIGLSRLIALDHYPSDVILGAYVGIMSVYWAQFFQNKLYARLAK